MTGKSTPPTPPSRAPNDDEQRFEFISSPCEWVEDYRPGGYHPVHLDDTLNNGQYKVIRKLGDGAYSTVWLARDQINKRYIALKILVSEISASTVELRIFATSLKLRQPKGRVTSLSYWASSTITVRMASTSA
ncbi:hypothetical protein MFIFM68171_06382 [Madurella fahalii]|uniref:non-specific serine/threonine protein kinase n=1 Tax=Madurella fahalii TaxID=1157608 RepID=A0ABQ0GEI6_9PEZI